jgi:hypothetical protein
MDDRVSITNVPSGSVDLVWNGVFARIEFNCNCMDALPLCNGMCCRKRSGYSVELEEDELGFYQHRYHPITGAAILATTEDGMTCIYHRIDGKCGIHNRRPKMCRQWHCSPQGALNDEEIVRRDSGWILNPVRKEETEFVQLRR